MRKQAEENPPTLSAQLREIIESAGISRYRLAKESGVDAGQLCRFIKGNGRLSMESLDSIGSVLGLSFQKEPQAATKPVGKKQAKLIRVKQPNRKA